GSDIDLNVIHPECDLNMALEIFDRFVRQGSFLRFGFIDSVRGKPAWADPTTYPVGYYLGMVTDFEGTEWKVETWLLRLPPPSQDWIQDRMNPEQQRTILALKHLRNTGNWKASSYDIYRAVLLGGARNPSEADSWLRKEQEPKL